MNASAVTPVCVVSQVQVCHGLPKTPGPRIANKLCFKLDSAPKLSRQQTAHAPAVSYACGFRFEAWPGCRRVECVAELADDVGRAVDGSVGRLHNVGWHMPCKRLRRLFFVVYLTLQAFCARREQDSSVRCVVKKYGFKNFVVNLLIRVARALYWKLLSTFLVGALIRVHLTPFVEIKNCSFSHWLAVQFSPMSFVCCRCV